MEYQNVADEAINAGTAADFIISQMKAFNIEAENAQHIIDAVDFISGYWVNCGKILRVFIYQLVMET